MKRFQYHFEPKAGWMNDPNGLIQYNGVYHAFFQNNPYDTKWGPMHWGHAISHDLIHWEEQEIALKPEEEYEDAGGCFSGSAIEKDGMMYLFYTSVSQEYGQAQSVAFSEDGIHFSKYEGNPVIKHYPKSDATEDFRDPKVFQYQNEYRMIVGTVYKDHGRILQYRSDNLLDWEYMGVLYESHEYNNVIECPDLFCVDGRWILMYSKIGQPLYQEQFIIGDYDGKCFIPQCYLSPEAGPQFYAAQTFQAEDGRRILIAWYYDWSRKVDDGVEVAGAFTIPRELYIEDDRVRMYPVKTARKFCRRLSLQPPEKMLKNQCTIPGISVFASTLKVSIKADVWDEAVCYEGQIESVDILEDEKAVEVFINDGEISFSVWH